MGRHFVHAVGAVDVVDSLLEASSRAVRLVLVDLLPSFPRLGSLKLVCHENN